MAVSVMRACRGKGKTGVSSAATWVGEALNFLQNVLNENDILDLLVPICMFKWCSLELQLGTVIIVLLKECSCFIGNGVFPFPFTSGN